MALISNILVLRTAGGDAMDLLAAICGEYGVGTTPKTVAQVKLAEWLVTAEEASVRRFKDVPERIATGMLTAEVVPSDGMAQWIAEMTGGAVLPAMFHQTPKVETPLPTEGGDADRAPDRHPVNEDLKVHLCAGKVHIVGESWHVVMSKPQAQGLLAGLQSKLATRPAMGGGAR